MAYGIYARLKESLDGCRVGAPCWVHADFSKSPSGKLRVLALNKARQSVEVDFDTQKLGEFAIKHLEGKWLEQSKQPRWIAGTTKEEARIALCKLLNELAELSVEQLATLNHVEELLKRQDSDTNLSVL